MTKPTIDSQRFIPLGLFIFSVLVYGQALFFGYINYDDPYYLDKEFIRDGFQLADIKSLFSETGTNLWHPLTWASFYLDHYAGSSMVSHAINILLHALNSSLLYLVLRKIPTLAKAAIFVALIHIIHPLHIENVAWVSARKDLLSLCFILLSLHSYISYCSDGKRCWLSILYFLLALMCKPIAVVTPIFYIAIALCFKGCTRKRSNITLISSAILISSLFCLFSIWIHKNSPNAEITVQAEILDKWALIGYNYLHYCYQFLLPNNLSFFYPNGGSLPLVTYLGYGTFLLSLAAALCLLYKRFQKVAILWLLYIISLAPASGIITIGDAVRADRYLYIPAIFLTIILVEAGIKLSSVARPKVTATLYAVIGVWAGYTLTYGQFYLSKWKSNHSLYSHAIELNPQNYLAYHNLAKDQAEQGQNEQALQNYHKVIEIIPNYKNVRLRIARIYESIGQNDKAFSYIVEEFTLHPTADNLLALAYNRYHHEQYESCIKLLDDTALSSPNLSLLRGSALIRLKQYDNAIASYQTVPHQHFSDSDLLSYAYVLIARKHIPKAKAILAKVKDKSSTQYRQLMKLTH